MGSTISTLLRYVPGLFDHFTGFLFASTTCARVLAPVSTVRMPICYAFPGYMTFKSIRTKHPQAQKAWLQYWAVVSVLLVLEFLLSIVLFRIPGYNLFFTSIFISMAWPQSTLTPKIFNMIAPKVAENESTVDEMLRRLEGTARHHYPKIEPYVNQAQYLFSKQQPGAYNFTPTEATKKD
ncbi:hypothetical protein NDN08_003574 [Rhodosorus marinus]|uniref:HVA22-like protein n=1 Tax=Rhodosorus marinus TaxID=101924 RepID=A0AAV8V1N4_9RHOD|nr:hypothetical protein NDN08_003574 [Rhodosorus marinus]